MEIKIEIDGNEINFQIYKLEITNKNQENIFIGNTRSLGYKLDKAILNSNDRLHKIAKFQKDKYSSDLDLTLGEFLLNLKRTGNEDYLLYLNKYGDKKYCNYSINNHLKDKGIYIYIVHDEIVYAGRSKKTFEERFKEYGKITPYNCLIDGQATNCNINSKLNEIDDVKVGFYLMNQSTDKEIEILEKKIIQTVKSSRNSWNIQKS